MALNSSGPISLAGSTAGQSIAVELGQGATSQISLNDTAVRTLAGIASGAITMPTNFWGKSSGCPPRQRGSFYSGQIGYGYQLIQNLVSNTGVVSGDITTVNTAAGRYMACPTFSCDKGMYYGGSGRNGQYNFVSNTGVISAAATFANSTRESAVGTGYGITKGIVMLGTQVTSVNWLNSKVLITDTGVLGSDENTVASVRKDLGAVTYGTDTAIVAYGMNQNNAVSMSNKISNTGVVASDVAGVGTARSNLGTSSYGGDKGIFAYGTINTSRQNVSNKVSNTGVIASDTAGVGTARTTTGCGYGGDKGIFAYGYTTTQVSMKNLCSNTGVISADQTGVGTARADPAAVSYSTS